MNRLLNMLGLCMRAGRVISGEKACVQAIRAGAACCAIMDRAAAGNAVKSVTNACEFHQVPLIWAEEDSLGYAIGKPGRMVAVVTDPSMAEKIINLGAQIAARNDERAE